LQDEVSFSEEVVQLIGLLCGALSVCTCGDNLVGDRPVTAGRLPIADRNLRFGLPREAVKRRFEEPSVVRRKLQGRQHFFDLLPLRCQRSVVDKFLAIRIP
jgi:hypothetical protein